MKCQKDFTCTQPKREGSIDPYNFFFFFSGNLGFGLTYIKLMILFSVTKQTIRTLGEEMEFSDKPKGFVWLEPKPVLPELITILFTYILRQPQS